MLTNMPLVVPIVLSGGAGSRLWPASRESHPKPFITLPDGETLIQKTYARAKSIGSEILTVTNRDYYFMSRDVQEGLGISGDFLLEPFGRNTAPAIALAAKYVESVYGAGTVIIVLAADHLIAGETGFLNAVSDATRLAAEGYLVTFGIPPSVPETGFGYIQKGDPLEHGYKVASFVEKPDLNSARDYVSSGNYLWNSGMFCFTAGCLLREIAEHAPDINNAVDVCWKNMQEPAQSSARTIEIPSGLFKSFPDVSIDYAVMEKSMNVAVIEGAFKWNDVGSWSAYKDLLPPDGSSNRSQGNALFFDTSNTYIQSEERLVAAVGVSDLMIIDTPDALLVTRFDKSQDVKKVVARLKADNHEAYKFNREVVRPWGTYTVLEVGLGYKIKRIEVKPGASLSLQMHQHRSEHWVVVSGTAKITNGEQEVLVKDNESTFIPAGRRHRLENPGQTLCVMIEVQCGSYLGEDDIIRFDDKYGR